MRKENRKIVIVNQAVNYLTIGFANAFDDRFSKVVLITGSVHSQGEELHSSIDIDRINTWQEDHGLSKALNYLVALSRIYYKLIFKYRSYEVFFVSAPPMGYLLNIILPHRFSMLIWDVYPDLLKITGMKESHVVYRFWSILNRRSFKKAYRLFTIGEKMADLLADYVMREKIIIQPIWSIFQKNLKVDKFENPFVVEHELSNKFIVQYSGNIGLTHKVELMVELADLMHGEEGILFQIIGRGPRVSVLKKMVSERKLPNCQFLPFQSDEMFPYSLSAADVGVVILDELTSKGSVPSKSYNLMSYGIPSLYIASSDSELQNYANNYNHAGCFSEGKLENAVKFILELKDNKSYYTKLSINSLEASKEFRRENANKFVEKYLYSGEAKNTK